MFEANQQAIAMNLSPIQVTPNAIIHMVSVTNSGENPNFVDVSSNWSPFSASSWAREMENIENSKGNSGIFTYIRRNKSSPEKSASLGNIEKENCSEKLAVDVAGVNARDLIDSGSSDAWEH